MEITRDYPAEKLANSTKAYRRSVWRRIAVGLVLGTMLVYIVSELIKGAANV